MNTISPLIEFIIFVGPEDIVNGNKKLILGLMWSCVLRYQIGKTEVCVSS